MSKEYMMGMGTRGENTIEISDALKSTKDDHEKKRLEREEERAEAKHEAEMAKEKAKKKEAERDAEGAGGRSETGVQVVGKIDVMESQRKAEQRAEDSQAYLAQENDRLKQEAKEKEEALRQKEKELAEVTLKSVQENFTLQTNLK